MKRCAAVCAGLTAAVIIYSIDLGTELGHPAQMHVGAPAMDLNAQAIAFRSDSGTNVRGWWCPVDHSRTVVLLLAGKGGNRLSMIDRARFLRRAGFSVLLIDLQATGESEGQQITFGWKESRDVIAAVRFIRDHQPSSQIAIIGSSLGGAAALLAMPSLRVDGMVLEAVYPTIRSATKNRIEKYLGGWARFSAPLLLAQLPMRLGISASDLRPIDHIGSVHCPILIMGGDKDRDTTPEETRAMFLRATAPKDLWLIPNVGHVDLHRATQPEYESRVVAFLNKI